MIFNSIEFLIFAILFFSIWPLVRKQDSSRWIFIVFASFVFYGWWDWRFLFLIVSSGLVDYCAGLAMVKFDRKRTPILILSLMANLGSLLVFKYSVFFAHIFEDLLLYMNITVDLEGRIPEFALILPVGISFYTFQSLSYTLDIYRKRLQPTRNILHFFSFLAMFPQLVAGPIIRAKDLLKQLKTYRIPNDIEKWNAVKMICYGLFQKVVIADNLAGLVDAAYEGKSLYTGSAFWWYVAFAFSFQIYADFSGYSLIARGLAKLMGYHFRMNFNHPYLSTGLRQFWNRWHISLSTWFRDYVYIPIGGSRNGIAMGTLALVVTMLLSGIWHGANYTFIAWAMLHSIYLLAERHLKWTNKLKKLRPLLIFITFIQVSLAWVYFRADSIADAHKIIGTLFSFDFSQMGFVKSYFDESLFLLLALLIETLVYIRKQSLNWRLFYKKHQSPIDIALLAISIVCIIFLRGEGHQFIYFQF